MIILDAVLFMGIVAVLHYYKSTHPNFLFFCKGAILFLPPDDQQLENIQNSKNNQIKKQSNNNNKKISNKLKEQPQGHQISIIQVEYNQVKTYPFCTQFQRIAMTIATLLGFYLIRASLYFILPPISYLPFYIIVAILIYSVKVSVDVFMVSAYKSKTVIFIALGVNLFYLFLAFTLSNIQDIYDNSIKIISQDYAKHLQIIFGNSIIAWINEYTVLSVVIFMNFFMTLASIPTVVKFGNWYSKTLKQVYYEDDSNQENMQKILNTTKQTTKQTQKQLKQHSKSTISLLNYHLIATLIFIFLSHRFILTYLNQQVVDGLRLIFFGVQVFIILWTAKDAIEFNGAFAYQFVLEYFKEKTQQGRLALRRKIVPYIYHIWYHFHQFMIRVVIPILLVFLIVHWKYLTVQTSIQDRYLISQNNDKINKSTSNEAVSTNYDIQCSLNTNEFNLLKNMYKCPIKSYRQMEQQLQLVSSDIISGSVISQIHPQSPTTLQQKVLHYGVIRKDFMLQICQLLLWYSSITIYAMTVIYVLFLRKTVYEI